MSPLTHDDPLEEAGRLKQRCADDQAQIAHLVKQVRFLEGEGVASTELHFPMLAAAIASVPEGLIIANAEGSVLMANPAALSMHGYHGSAPRHLAELTDTLEMSSLDGVALPLSEWPLARALRGETFAQYELRLQRSDTGEQWVGSYGGGPVRNDQGEVILAAITCRDVTEQHQVQDALRTSEEEYREMFELAAIGYAEAEPLTGRFLRVNCRLCEITGYSVPELLSLSFRDLTHAEEAERDFEAYQQFIRGGRSEYSKEKRYVRKDGRVIWVQVNVVIKRDATGRPLRALGMVQDISERRRVEEDRARLLVELGCERQRIADLAIQAEERAGELEATLACMMPGVVLCNLSGQVVRANGVARETLGFGPETAGLSVIERAARLRMETPEGQPFPADQLPSSRALRGETVQNIPMVIQAGPQGPRWVLASAAPVRRGDGKLLGAVSTFADVTRLHDTEQRLADTNAELAVRNQALAELTRRIETKRAKLNAIIEHAPVGIVVTDEQGQVEHANPAAALLGMRPVPGGGSFDDVLRVTCIGPAGDPPCLTRMALQGEPGSDVELSVLQPNGRRRELLASAAPIKDVQGGVRGAVLVFQDITERKRAERALRESEARFRNMADNAPVMIWVSDPGGYCTYLNRQWYDFTGTTERQGLGFGWLDSVHPDDRSHTLGAFRDANAWREALWMEYRLRRPGGAYRWVIDSASPRFGSGGEFLGYIGSAIDIDERRRAEEQIRFQSQLLNAVLQPIIATDHEGCINYWGRGAKALFGWQEDEVLGRGVLDVLLPQVARGLSPGATTARLTGACWTGEIMVEDRYGRLLPLLMTSTPIRNDDGTWLGTISVATDLSVQKQVEVSLRSANQRLRIYERAIESSPDLIYVVDPDYVYQMVNPAHAHAHGRPVQQIVGRTLCELLGPQAFQGALPHLRRCFAGEQVRFESAFDYPALGRRDLDVGYYPLQDEDGKVEYAVVMIRDITERKHIERLKNEFVSVVSHELRTPLTSIAGSLGLINGGVAGELPARARPLIEIAYRNSERLTRLINDILDADKIESGRVAFNLKLVDLTRLVEEAIEANRPYAAQFGVRLALEEVLPGVQVRADPDRLIQVLTNLLSNAAKFSPPDQTVAVRVKRSGEAIRVKVTDQGPGIPEEFRAHVFEKFVQADASDSRAKGGTGLGLSICKAIVNRLGGHIGFETQQGQGTTFYFDLPACAEG
jgi:PAS domain S-box-containing protein